MGARQFSAAPVSRVAADIAPVDSSLAALTVPLAVSDVTERSPDGTVFIRSHLASMVDHTILIAPPTERFTVVTVMPLLSIIKLLLPALDNTQFPVVFMVLIQYC